MNQADMLKLEANPWFGDELWKLRMMELALGWTPRLMLSVPATPSIRLFFSHSILHSTATSRDHLPDCVLDLAADGEDVGTGFGRETGQDQVPRLAKSTKGRSTLTCISVSQKQHTTLTNFSARLSSSSKPSRPRSKNRTPLRPRPVISLRCLPFYNKLIAMET